MSNPIDSTLDQVMKEPKKVEAAAEGVPEKDQGPKVLLWALAVIALVVVGIFLMGLIPDKGETVEYNHFEFEESEGLWWTLWERDGLQFILSLRHNPYETLNISVKGKIDKKFERDTVYITFDPELEDQSFVALAAAELSLNLVRALGVEVIASCTVNKTDACSTKPIVNCDNGNLSVILLQETNKEARVILQDECITLQGEGEELARAVDRVVYTFYGIIPSLHQTE